jgi:hypothetical protein
VRQFSLTMSISFSLLSTSILLLFGFELSFPPRFPALYPIGNGCVPPTIACSNRASIDLESTWRNVFRQCCRTTNTSQWDRDRFTQWAKSLSWECIGFLPHPWSRTGHGICQEFVQSVRIP